MDHTVNTVDFPQSRVAGLNPRPVFDSIHEELLVEMKNFGFKWFIFILFLYFLLLRIKGKVKQNLM